MVQMGTPNQAISSGIAPPTVPGTPTGSAQAVTFNEQNIAPPSDLYIARDDRLFVFVVNLGTQPEVVTVSGRLLLFDGTIRPFQVQLNVQPALSNTIPIDLAEGFLLSVNALAQQATQRGLVFVRINILRGAAVVFNSRQVLLADYVTNVSAISWPTGRQLSPVDGPGAMVTLNVAAPVAGADWSLSLPTASRVRIISVFATLTTNANVANRIPRLRLQSGATVLFISPPNQVVPASTVANFSGSSAPVTASANVPDVCVGVPPGTWGGINIGILSSITANIQAGDQWSQVQVLIEQWLDGS